MKSFISSPFSSYMAPSIYGFEWICSDSIFKLEQQKENDYEWIWSDSICFELWPNSMTKGKVKESIWSDSIKIWHLIQLEADIKPTCVASVGSQVGHRFCATTSTNLNAVNWRRRGSYRSDHTAFIHRSSHLTLFDATRFFLPRTACLAILVAKVS